MPSRYSIYNDTNSYGFSGNYATLGNYHGGMRGIHPPVPSTIVTGQYIVPGYSAPGYSTLMHGLHNGGCNGTYFNIGQAYGYNAGNCNTQYMGSLCQ
jgi:hypothetical protein